MTGSRDEPGLGRPRGANLLRLYPAAWRRRYGTEMVAMLEQLPVGRRDRLDLVRGALDAHLHGHPRAVGAAAVLAGAAWTLAGAWTVVQPTPPAWPGYVLETLPLALAGVVAGLVAIVGCWARRSDAAGRLGAVIILVAILGQLGWAGALAAALTGGEYGVTTAAAHAAGVLGCLIVGLVLLRHRDERVGGLLTVAPAAMLFAWPIAWLGYGLSWTLLGMIVLADAADDDPRSSAIA